MGLTHVEWELTNVELEFTNVDKWDKRACLNFVLLDIIKLPNEKFRKVRYTDGWGSDHRDGCIT